MLNTIIGYYLGSYRESTGKNIDFMEFISHPEDWIRFRDSKLEFFMEIHRIIQKEDRDQCTKLLELLECSEVDEEDLPFYLLPIAYHPNWNLEETSQFLEKILKSLTLETSVLTDVVLVVMSVKWGIYTKSSPLSYIARLFPKKVCEVLTCHSLVNDALFGFYNMKEESACLTEIESAIKSVSIAKGNLPMKSALAAAFAEVLFEENYQYDEHPENDIPFLYSSERHIDWDPAIVKGYQRIDGYYSWVMNSKNQALCMNIIGDENGPDRDMLRIWHLLNKKLNLVDLYLQVDEELKRLNLWDSHEKWKDDIQNVQISLPELQIQLFLVHSRRPIRFEIKKDQICLDRCLDIVFGKRRTGRPITWLKDLLDED